MTRPGRGGHSAETRAEVLKAIQGGGKVREVAKAYGISTYAVWTWLKAAGVPKRAPGPARGSGWTKAQRMSQGRTLREQAEARAA